MSDRSNDIKKRAHLLVDSLPVGATWDDLIDAVYVLKSLDAGLADANAGRVISVEEVRKRFGLTP